MEPVLHAMADRIRHRGPDDADYYMDGEISLGFRRLSIIDLEGGRQPILNEDKSKVLMFNGEIYNYQSLREDLLKAGHVFTTKTDSEVLLHGFEEYGTDLLNKLRGMFAFIIWDKNTKTLFGARDYFGIKPFYYAKMQGTLMFGKRNQRALWNTRTLKRELNETRTGRATFLSSILRATRRSSRTFTSCRLHIISSTKTAKMDIQAHTGIPGNSNAGKKDKPA